VRDGSSNIVMLDQEAQVDATMSTLTLDLRVGVAIASTGLYVTAGAAGSLLRNGSYNYTERLKGPAGATYSDSHTTEHMLVAGQSFEQYEKTAFDLRGGLGYLVEVGPVMLNPEIFYSLPLTSAFAAPDQLKQSGIVGSIGVLYNLGE
jgi:hypothetical protein